jgi:hypothetical protein
LGINQERQRESVEVSLTRVNDKANKENMPGGGLRGFVGKYLGKKRNNIGEAAKIDQKD